MPFRPISEDFKVRAIQLYDEGHLPDDIYDIMGISMRSLYRWRENLEIHGDVAPAHDEGPGSSLIAYHYLHEKKHSHSDKVF